MLADEEKMLGNLLDRQRPDEFTASSPAGTDHPPMDGREADIVTIPVANLRPGESPRMRREDPDHARALAEVSGFLPPILVHRPTMRVIDGMHRVRAVLMRGQTVIRAQFFDGSEEMAFVLAVKRNIAHGLPLSLAEREAAAERMLAAQPHWSDRSIANATGLAARTIAGIRERATDDSPHSNTRVGRDGRLRPINGAQGRLRASRIIEAEPDISLRAIARQAGISVSTARDVRDRVRQGKDPLPPRQRDAGRAPRSSTRPAVPGRAKDSVRAPLSPTVREFKAVEWSTMRQKLRQDPAMRYAASGRVFLNWLDTHVIDSEDWRQVIAAVPSHWAGEIAALARSSAERWQNIAQVLEYREANH